MSRPYYGQIERVRRTGGMHEAKRIDEVLLQDRFERMRKLLDEIEMEHAKITVCPMSCRDGTVLISPPSGTPRYEPCRILSADCAYGKGIDRELERYLISVASKTGVPQRHIENFPRLMNTFPVREARKWIFKGFLVFSGKPGVGKSFGIAYGIYWYLHECIFGWTNRDNWSAALKASVDVQWASAKEIIDDKALASRCRSVHLLALDDFGKEDMTRTGMAAICDVIAKRYDCKLPTLITTELTTVDLQNRYGQYIAERLGEDGGSSWFECDGESLRLIDEGGGEEGQDG